jgi:CPA1 family monovalent cation:H+ antiporter
MELFELVLVLLLTGAVLTVVAQRIGAPYPALLAVAGAALALMPFGTAPVLDPELSLALFVAPTLMDAAFDASPRDLRANWLPVGSLALIAVAVTVAAVAIVARLLVPGMPWAVAIVLGAIVAPPDASAATAVLRQLAPPYRVMVILEGESMLNDASALLIYRVAMGVVAGGAISFLSAGWLLVVTCLGGAILGFVAARLYVLLVRPAHDIAVSVVTQFVGTFAVWLFAERLGVSPVITTVCYAITIARLAPSRLGAEHRRASYAVWEVAVFVLNALAFILIGLQLRGVLARMDGHVAATAGFAGAVLLTVVVARFGWVIGFTGLLRQFGGPSTFKPPFKGSVLVSWCGMRGIVTLATALALPVATGGVPEFPYRDLLVAAAFAVVLGTLVIQGITLAPLLRWLNLADDGAIERELLAARHETAEAAIAVLRATAGSPAAALLIEYETTGSQVDRHSLTLQIIEAKRKRLQHLRRTFVIGDHTFQQLEEELDWAEGHTLRRLRSAG